MRHRGGIGLQRRVNIVDRKHIEAYTPFSGSNRPPFSIVFRNDDGRLLNDPSASIVALPMSDWLLTSLVDIRVVGFMRNSLEIGRVLGDFICSSVSLLGQTVLSREGCMIGRGD
jgi:hypothetical protein